MFTTAAVAGGRRREGGREGGGIPRLCAQPTPLRWGPRAELRSGTPPPLLYWGGPTSCLWGRLLLLCSGDPVPNTSAASLRDARLTDSCLSQSLPGPLERWTFPTNGLDGGEGGPS